MRQVLKEQNDQGTRRIQQNSNVQLRLNTHWTGTMAQFTERSPCSRLEHTKQAKNTRMINEHVQRSRTQYLFKIKHSLNRDDSTIHWTWSSSEQSSGDKPSSGNKQSSKKEQKDERTCRTSHRTEQNSNVQLRSSYWSCDQWRNLLTTFMTLAYNGCPGLQVNFELYSRFVARY